MPAPREYDEETRARAVRTYQERIRDVGESKLTPRRAVEAMVDINPETLPNWIEREEIHARGIVRDPSVVRRHLCLRLAAAPGT